VHVGAIAALLRDQGAAEIHVEVGHVQAEDLLGAGAGLVEHPPQHPLAQRVAVVGEQPLQP
jgi:hypothetical protein